MSAGLQAKGLTRSFGHVRALDDADFDIYPGEVVALIGDNGAGKSTMVKALSGNLQLDDGRIEFEGRPVELSSRSRPLRSVWRSSTKISRWLPTSTRRRTSSWAGRSPPRASSASWASWTTSHARQARASFDELGATVPSMVTPVGTMSGGQRQCIAIARAITWADKVVFLDEPTAALGVVQTKNVLETIKRVRDKGIAVVFISHSMPHVLEVADRIQVLRLGRRIATFKADKTHMEELVGAMTGALDAKEPAA